MIKSSVDYLVSVFAPGIAANRAKARRVERSYKAGESDRLSGERPKNQAADSVAQGPFGADASRAWARKLVLENEHAWAAKESVLSEVIGSGFILQSALEAEDGEDEPDTNENRDKTWAEWCEVCDINGQLTYDEMQVLAFGEMFEAGECLLHFVPVPLKHKGILRPVPLALELIEADRLASDYDTYAFNRDRSDGIRITRGVEMDKDGMPLAYWVYPSHPTEPNVFRRTPERIPANRIKHLFRRDRIGQSRGLTWLGASVAPLRMLGTYRENEMQASAVDGCFTTAIKTETPLPMGNPPSSGSGATQDSDGNSYQWLQPGMILNLRPGESLESASPGRPNSSAGPWIDHMTQGVAAGTGTSYESVSKDFSKANYSSSRTSKLENRPRYRRWQKSWGHHFCLETWDRFCNAAALAGRLEFPSMVELLTDRRTAAPVEIMTPEWEWVDIKAEQSANEAAVAAHQRSGTDVLGAMGKNYRRTQRKIAQEKAYRAKLGEQFGVDMRTTAEAKQAADVSKETTAEAAVMTAEAAQENAEAVTV